MIRSTGSDHASNCRDAHDEAYAAMDPTKDYLIGSALAAELLVVGNGPPRLQRDGDVA
jgi:hypothetical protein